jgi:hypothetical protein
MIIEQKTGFKTNSPALLIYECGMPFYSREKIHTGFRFNLPAGEYEVRQGDLDQCEVVEYPLMKIDEPNNVTAFPKGLELVWIPTPAKCQIDVYNNKVYADPIFKKFPKYVFKWVYGHELGHFLYKGEGLKSEKNCDVFSGNLLLTEGYNPSQIRSAIDLAISNRLSSLCRKYNVLDKLQEIELWKQH